MARKVEHSLQNREDLSLNPQHRRERSQGFSAVGGTDRRIMGLSGCWPSSRLRERLWRVAEYPPLAST